MGECPHEVLDSGFANGKESLPFLLTVRFEGGKIQSFDVYLWTICHGGRTRNPNEYRIQLKLEHGNKLERVGGVPLLLGYYEVPSAAGGVPHAGSAFVAWDPLRHLRLGRSSSCQVPLIVIQRAIDRGVELFERPVPSGKETILAFRTGRLPAYLRLASAGHNSVPPVEFSRSLD